MFQKQRNNFKKNMMQSFNTQKKTWLTNVEISTINLVDLGFSKDGEWSVN